MKKSATASLLLAANLCLLCIDAAAQAGTAASAPSSELAVLRAQLETTRQFQDSFMNMVQWTLGSAIAVALALAGFGWYTNRANYDRDRRALEQEAETLKASIAATVSTEVMKVAQSLESTMTARQLFIQQAVEKTFQPKLTAISEQAKNLKGEVFDLKASSLEREAEEAREKENYKWAIYKYCELLDLCVARDTDFYEAADALDSIRDIVRRPNLVMDSDTVNSTVETLKRLPAKHHAACEPLIEALKRSLR
jgi:hypothetical protein